LLIDAHQNSDTILWKLCHCDNYAYAKAAFYPALSQLLARRSSIQQKLAHVHATETKALFCYLTTFDVSIKELDYLEFDFDQEHYAKMGMTGLWTNSDGAPWGLDLVLNDKFGYLHPQIHMSNILKSLPPHPIVFIGDSSTITQEHFLEAGKLGYRSITSLPKAKKQEFIDKNFHQWDLLCEDEAQEFLDTEDPSLRYIVYRKKKVRELELPVYQKFLKRKSTDFNIVMTDVPKELMSPLEIKEAYQKWHSIKHCMGLIEMSSVEALPLYQHLGENASVNPGHELSERTLQSIDFTEQEKEHSQQDAPLCQYEQCLYPRLFLRLLSYSLKNEINQRLKLHAYTDSWGEEVKWNCTKAIEKMKGIKCQSMLINNIILKEVKNVLDEDQKKIISCLNLENDFYLSPES
jgi:hypothetical protein